MVQNDYRATWHEQLLTRKGIALYVIWKQPIIKMYTYESHATIE